MINLNEVFLIGRIITDIEFKFIIHSKNISIAQFEIMVLDDKQVIQIAAYNEMADFVYSKLNKNDRVCINGYIVANNIILTMVESFNDENFKN